MKAIASVITLLGAVAFGQVSPGQSAAQQDTQFHLTHTSTVPEFQEISNLVRTITEFRDVSTDNTQMLLTVRGTPEQIGLAEWLVKNLDQAVDGSVSPISSEYKGLSDDTVVRIFHLPHTATAQEFQEAANATRTITEIRRMFTYNDGRAVAIRATPDQVATAEWMIQQLDQAAAAQASAQTPQESGEFRVGDNDVMRVFYLTNAKTTQDFQEIANAIRTTTEIRRLFTVNATRAMTVRATPDEMAMAEWLVGQLDKPAGAQAAQASGEYRTPGAADDVTRVFYLPAAQSLQDFQGIVNALRSATQIRTVFTYNAQRAVAIRGTANQLALAETLIHDLSR
jgi:type II secretory pathway component GspD/PulD (secretin)